jgi:hypothetical protein
VVHVAGRVSRPSRSITRGYASLSFSRRVNGVCVYINCIILWECMLYVVFCVLCDALRALRCACVLREMVLRGLL